MDDKMRRIAPSDLLTLTSTPTDPMATFSDAAATHPTYEAVCPQCEGAGYYKEAVPFGHPHFVVLFPCECKLREKELRRVEELDRMSTLELLRDKTFETFVPDVPGVRTDTRGGIADTSLPDPPFRLRVPASRQASVGIPARLSRVDPCFKE